VIGLTSTARNSRIAESISSKPKFSLLSIDYNEPEIFEKVLKQCAPDEIYNLAAVSSVKFSFDHPYETARINGFTPIRFLEAIRKSNRLAEIKFYQASSSEMFGNGKMEKKSEDSPFKPNSPYAVSKLFAHQTCNIYREAYGMFVSCGILFNHESILRTEQFVSRKITMEVARIAAGHKEKLTLGSLHPRRDWGYAGDYVLAMWKMLQHNTPDDFVIATGKSHSVLEFASLALSHAGLTGDPMNYIETDTSLIRPLEIEGTYGDSTKAREILNWKPTIEFDELVKTMVTHDIKLVAEKSLSQ
jgi:GDPmannose 4,6-dehydratase